MDTFNLQELISSHSIDLIWNAFLYGLGGLLLGILILFALRKAKLLKRKRKVLKVFVALYYFFIPAIFTALFGCFGFINGVEGVIIKDVNFALEQIGEATLPSFENYVKNKADSNVTFKSVKHLVSDFLATDETIDTEKISGKIMKPLLLEAVETGAEMMAKQVGVKEKRVAALLEAVGGDEPEEFRKNVIWAAEDIAARQVKVIFIPFYFAGLLPMLILLLVPIVEIVLSNVLGRKKQDELIE